jgi:Arc/MetJ-type ribon-helix-helix transcriptional regulator
MYPSRLNLKTALMKESALGATLPASEVIREALRLLEIAEAAKQRRLIDIRQKIDRGLEHLDQGRGIDPETARAKLRAARRKK